MSEYVDAVRAEIDKQLGWTPRHDYAEAWDQAVTTAMRVVGPILDGWEQRLSDVREEYRKSLESWDRTRERLTNEAEQAREDCRILLVEIGLLRREVEFEANAETFWLDSSPRLCACVSDEQATQLGSGFTLPVCTVHPEGGGQ